MRYPPRLSHLLTDAVLVARLAPGYAHVHRVDLEEARLTLAAALRSGLRDDLIEAAWQGIRARAPRFKEETALEKIAAALAAHPQRAGRVPPISAPWSAFWVAVGLEAGTASDTARAVLESEAGRAQLRAGLEEAGRFLAAELARS